MTHLETRTKSLCFLFRKLSFHCDKLDLLFLYKSLLYPVLSYGYPAWCNVTNVKFNKIKGIVKRIGRIFQNSDLDIQQSLNDSLISLYNAARSPSHPLHCILPPIRETGHNLRRCVTLPKTKTERFKRHFISKSTYLVLTRTWTFFLTSFKAIVNSRHTVFMLLIIKVSLSIYLSTFRLNTAKTHLTKLNWMQPVNGRSIWLGQSSEVVKFCL